MLFNLKILTLIGKTFNEKNKKLVDKANLRENKNRIDCDNVVVHKIYIKNDEIQRKMDCCKEGPFEITDEFTNGTVKIQCGNVNECIIM